MAADYNGNDPAFFAGVALEMSSDATSGTLVSWDVPDHQGHMVGMSAGSYAGWVHVPAAGWRQEEQGVGVCDMAWLWRGSSPW